MSHSFRMTSLGLLLALAVGCGDSTVAPTAPTAAVSGKVMYRGKPLNSGMVMFYPDGGDKPASGIIQPNGSFTLSTFAPDDGAVLGKHKVVIQSIAGGSDVGTGTTSLSSVIPAKYGAVDTTPLTQEVASGLAPVTFTLED